MGSICDRDGGFFTFSRSIFGKGVQHETGSCVSVEPTVYGGRDGNSKERVLCSDPRVSDYAGIQPRIQSRAGSYNEGREV